MKKTIALLSLLSIIFLYSSCKKEEDILSKKLIDFTVGDNYIGETQNIYIWLTNTGGDIIDYVQLENGNPAQIASFEEFDNNERFSLHRLIVEKNGDYRLYTYADIEAGVFNFKRSSFDYGEKVGTTTFNFSEIPNHESYSLCSSLGNRFGSDLSYHTHSINLYKNVNQAYLYLKDNTTGYYKFINDLPSNETKDVSLNNMNDNMIPHTIDFELESNSHSVSIYGYTEKNNYTGKYTNIYSGSNYLDNSPKAFFHTPNENKFKAYRSHMSVGELCNPQKRYNFTTYGEKIPQNFEYINADLQIQTSNFYNLQLTTTGEFDYFRAYFKNSFGTNTAQWNFYNASGQNVFFPKIPSQITSLYPEVKKENIISYGNIHSYYICDSDYINSYDEYIDRLFVRKGEDVLTGIKNYKSVAFFFR